MFFSWKGKFSTEAGSFENFARSYNKFGLVVNANGDLEYREWAPAAKEVSLVSINDYFVHIYSLVISMAGTEKLIS